jgi:RNA polymerase sigma-70 factor (ECF subfamily)
VDQEIKHLEVIEAILNGETERFRELVDEFRDFVFTITLRVLTDPADAEEAAQDCFLKAYKNLNKFEGKSKLSTWLYRIAFNTAISYTRKKRVQTTQIDEIRISKYESIQDSLEAEDRSIQIALAMKQLLPMDALLLDLFYLKDLSLEEISKVTNLKSNAIKVKLFRARKRMARELRTLLEHEASSL